MPLFKATCPLPRDDLWRDNPLFEFGENAATAASKLRATDLISSQATCNCIAQELLEKYNLCLDDERKANINEKSRMSAQIAELESFLRRNEERTSELEQRVSHTEKELFSTKEDVVDEAELLTESFQIGLLIIRDAVASSVEKVMKKSEEQAVMIESLHRSVATFQKLYEEQQKTLSNIEHILNKPNDDGKKDLMVLFKGSQDARKKAYEQVSERARKLDEELTKLRTELAPLRSERDKAVIEADVARDRLNGYMETNIEYENRLRESSDSIQALEENSRKLSMEVSVLKHENEILVKSERRSWDVVHDLTRRFHNLQCKEISNSNEAALKQMESAYQDYKIKSETAQRSLEDEIVKLGNKLAEMEKSYVMKCEEAASCKEISNSNEAALKQMESAYQDYKIKSETAQRSLEDEIVKLGNKLAEMEKSYVMKCEEAASVIGSKDNDITTRMNEISILRNEVSQKVAHIENLEIKLASSNSAFYEKCNEISILRNEVSQKVAHTENLEIELASSKSACYEQCRSWRSAQEYYERQVIMQSETIQKLTNTSKLLFSAQQEITMLRQTAVAMKAENDALKTYGEQEKIGLLNDKNETLWKYNELKDQNRILHNQLEALHIRLAEKERNIAGLSSQHTDSHGEDSSHTLRENSIELEHAKILLSEREAVIRNLEKLAECQSELGARQKKLIDIERRLEMVLKEKEGVTNANQSLLKQMEDLKSSQKTTSETANEEAVKEKDFRIQDKKKIEEPIEKHRQAVKQVIEHFLQHLRQLYSQIPYWSAVEEQFRSCFLAVRRVEEGCSPFQDSTASQTPLNESLTVDAAAAGREVATQRRPSQVKVMGEMAVSTLPKSSMEQRKSGRRPLKWDEEPQADAETSNAEGCTVVEKGGLTMERGCTVAQEKGGLTLEQGSTVAHKKGDLSLNRGSTVVQEKGQKKGGQFLERETSGGVPVLQPPSRKRQVRDDTSQGEANDDSPPSKKPKEEISQGTSRLKKYQSPPEGLTDRLLWITKMGNSLDKRWKQIRQAYRRDGNASGKPTEKMETKQAFVTCAVAQEKCGLTLERGSTVAQEKGDLSLDRGSTVVQEKGQVKGGQFLERETSGGVLVLQPSSRKRQVRDDTSQGEANDDNPPSKKPKGCVKESL